MTDVHPDQVLDALKRQVKRSNKTRNLEAIHAACAEVHRLGGTDFSYATIGRMAQQAGGPAAKTIYNTASEDYRTLVDAWEAHHRRSAKRNPAATKLATDDELLQKIDDPAARIVLTMAIAERNRLRAQLDTLKSQADITIDMRPLPGIANVDPKTGEVIQVISPLEDLTSAEVDALRKAIAPSFLKAQGWTEDADGQITSLQGRKLFEAGFGSAVRKVLGASPVSKR